jgi:hypothetical protein
MVIFLASLTPRWMYKKVNHFNVVNVVILVLIAHINESKAIVVAVWESVGTYV